MPARGDEHRGSGIVAGNEFGQIEAVQRTRHVYVGNQRVYFLPTQGRDRFEYVGRFEHGVTFVGKAIR